MFHSFLFLFDWMFNMFIFIDNTVIVHQVLFKLQKFKNSPKIATSRTKKTDIKNSILNVYFGTSTDFIISFMTCSVELPSNSFSGVKYNRWFRTGFKTA